MEESEVSTCSFGKECNESSVSPPSRNSNTIQSMALQNEHLQEVNEQLQDSIEALRAQLKDALDAANTAHTYSDQIQSMKIQVNEANQKRDSIAKELKDLQTTYKTEVDKYKEQIKKYEAESTDTSAKSKHYESQINRLRKERNQLKNAVEEKEQFLQLIDEEVQKAKASRKKLRQRTQTVAQQLLAAEQKTEELTFALQKSENEKTKLSQTIEALTLQITTANAFNDEAKNSFDSLKTDVEIKDKLISSLEAQLESQRAELEDFNVERPKFISLIQKSHKTLAASETLIDNLNDEISELRQKLKNTQPASSKISTLFSQANLLDLAIPFEGEINDKCEEILKLQQYQPLQRVQLILNEAAKHIADLEKENAENSKKIQELEKKQTNLPKQSDNDGIYGRILASLMNELRTFACPESEDDFDRFIAEKCATVDPIIANVPSSDFPQEFFSISSIEERMNVITNLLEGNSTAAALFKSQFLINGLLKNKNRSLSQSQTVLDSSNSQLIEQNQKTNETIQKLEEQVEKLKESRRQIYQQLKQARNQPAADASKIENDLKMKISQLQLQLETAQHENEILNVKLQVCQNDLLLQKKEAQSILQSQSVISVADEKLEDELKAKTKECEDLYDMVKQLQTALEETIKKQNKKSRTNEENLKKEIMSLQDQILQQEEENNRMKRKTKKQMRLMKEQFSKSIEEMTRNYEDSKTTFEDTVKTLTEQAEEARQMSQQLVQSLTACEQKNQKITAENQQLVQSQKELQIQVSSARQQFTKEKQSIQAQLTAQILSCESRIQQATVEMKAQYEKRISDLLELANQTIGSFYGIDDSFTEDTFAQLVNQAKSDLNKLKYFQSETTKYNPGH